MLLMQTAHTSFAPPSRPTAVPTPVPAAASTAAAGGGEEEYDPLEAFMAELNSEVEKAKAAPKPAGSSGGKATAACDDEEDPGADYLVRGCESCTPMQAGVEMGWQVEERQSHQFPRSNGPTWSSRIWAWVQSHSCYRTASSLHIVFGCSSLIVCMGFLTAAIVCMGFSTAAISWDVSTVFST